MKNAKKISKGIVASVLTMMLIVSCFVLPATIVNAANTVTVNFHYLRDDKNYKGWSLWSWGSGDGMSTDFVDTGDARGAVATVKITDGSSKLGFIVRKGNWEEKDPDGDRYLEDELASIISGTLDVYCVSQQEEFEVVKGKDVVEGTKIQKASADSVSTITYTLTAEENSLTADDFIVEDALGNSLPITKVEPNGNSGKITLGTEMDYSKDYSITFRGTKISVKMPEYFSSKEFEDAYTYDGNDLGATYTKEKTTFRVWAPTANKIELNIYSAGNGGTAEKVVEMTSDVKGTWVANLLGDLNGKYYTYTAYFDGKVNKDIVDPYAKSVGVNGDRGMILDLDSTNPSSWNNDARHTYKNAADMSIYELHVRDFSSDPDSGIKNTGKYLAFTENGTKDSKGVSTGIDHLKDLGITTVHILPVYDYATVDETKLDTPQYNWGYDPKNYNAPEGSYSTDPYHGEVRVNEYKQMVQALHNADIGVVMDVVYNHTYSTNYCFNQLVPGYFYRTDSNGSGCGNDVASERSMVRKFIVDSVSYWASEYHLDGFRFDLMGLIDVETMNAVREALDKIDPTIFIYGEGWSLSTNMSKDIPLATQTNSDLTPGIAYFSDTIRDAIKGGVFDAEAQGYVNGNSLKVPGIMDGVLGTPSWSPSPLQTITYASCHDNLTLWDKIASSNPDDSEADRIKQNLLSAAITYTSQGVPFIQAGEEFLRTKVDEKGNLVDNSYASPDSVNLLDYSRISDYSNVYNYYKGLISFRKAHSAFKMTSADDVSNNIKFVEEGLAEDVIAYSINDAASNEQLFVVYNAGKDSTKVSLPEGNWNVYVSGDKAGNEVLGTINNEVTVDGISATVLVKDNPQQESSDESSDESSNASSQQPSDNSNSSTNTVSNSVNSENSEGPANTGDNFQIVLVFIIAAVAGLVSISLYVSSKKAKTSK